ncbi:MAG: aminotransferase [Candidatus Yanofskybacteria bacterium RIFCSPLOWO2_01_FULL_49_25]|uniref:Aminotransferase n=1 Tax=Candidatus Yanofskybacteria bacterium RIFCSPLOWO2_01_FULL_49_25 TaxID=1802701 RepID=A0A1F8GZG2_9BACT|nr:MAG: aminotransferase [Candidatus Yanofskybacteria bacterium RIFCSPLOWO2_01_FULL_49_25]
MAPSKKTKSSYNIPQMEPWFDGAEASAVFEYMKSGGWVMEFKKTRELEDLIAQYTGAPHAVMTVNGTVSLTIALLALGLQPGDEVLVPDMTMIASPNSAKLVGMSPVLVDIDPKTLCMDLKKAKQLITKKTKAMMYVAFNGRSGNMHDVKRFCKKHGLFLIEDAAQAFGSFWNGKHLGTFGDIGSFSFSVPKIITTGQGGALVTRDENLFKNMKKMKDFGRMAGGVDIHDELGWNFKFTDIQAVIGIEQMKKLRQRVKRKREIYQRYTTRLKNIAEIELVPTDLKQTVPWFIDIYVRDRDGLLEYLKSLGIGTRPIYPAIHTQKIYATTRNKNRFPVSEDYAARGLWLPSSSKLSNQEIDYVTNAIKKYYQK